MVIFKKPTNFAQIHIPMFLDNLFYKLFSKHEKNIKSKKEKK